MTTPLILAFGGSRPRIAESAFVAPGAVVIGDVRIGPEASIWFGAVVRSDHPGREIRIGARANVQDNAVVHVSAEGSTVLEEEVTVGHGAVLDSCRIGRRTVVGMNAAVLQGARLGVGCVVAAGAVVKGGADVPGGRLVAGVPGRVRTMGPGATEWTKRSAAHYVALSRRYVVESACELCGGPVLARHCKVTCLNCGCQRDCSDP